MPEKQRALRWSQARCSASGEPFFGHSSRLVRLREPRAWLLAKCINEGFQFFHAADLICPFLYFENRRDGVSVSRSGRDLCDHLTCFFLAAPATLHLALDEINEIVRNLQPALVQ